MRLLDLFCGRWGWSRAFAARGWQCVGIDWAPPTEIPLQCSFVRTDVLQIYPDWIVSRKFDFIVASSPCEEFSVHGMKHFHPNPPYPSEGMRMFNHTRQLCEDSGLPYVMENVKQAQRFVGIATAHAGSFYLWGNAVPPLLHRGLIKGFGDMSTKHYAQKGWNGGSKGNRPKETATIPGELANCVADYAGRLLEQKQALTSTG